MCHEGRKVQERPGVVRKVQAQMEKPEIVVKETGRSQSSDVRSFQYCLHLSKDDQEVSLALRKDQGCQEDQVTRGSGMLL